MRIGIYGFGSIGRLIAREALERGHELAGVVDANPALVGRDAGEILGLGRLGVRVSKNPEELRGSDVVTHATGSFLDKVCNQILKVIKMSIDVISTCETLAYPYYRYPKLARVIDEAAREAEVRVIGTGINPGFLLDSLVIVVSASVSGVKRIRAVRSLDASKRRESFRKKVGLGLTLKEFRYLASKGLVTGHIGYAESVYLIADAAGLGLDRVEEGQEPVVIKDNVKAREGLVLGIRGYGAGYCKSTEVVRVELLAYKGALEYEEIVVKGRNYDVTWRSTGTPGDSATSSVILSVAEAVKQYRPGLLLMSRLLPFRFKFDVNCEG